MEILIILIIFGFIASHIAGQKNRSRLGWFLASVLLSPLVILILLFLKKIPLTQTNE